jgi:pyruvate dehydrogenase E2 component (dihydrolipoamide acetyltransferase)
MATVVELPRLSDTMEEGVVARWRVKVGDMVKRGQVIAEIETDKATMEFESFDAGVVLRLIAPEGQTLALGAPIAVLGQEGEDPSAALAGHGGNGAATAVPVAIPVTEPTAAAAASGVAAGPAAGVAVAPASSGRVPASPVARKLAREHGLELSHIPGSGPHGRVVKADVERAAQGAPATAATLSPDRDEHGRPFVHRERTLVAHSQMRKTIAKRMSQSKPGAPHFYLTVRTHMAAAVRLRREFNEAVTATKVSINDLVVMAAARGLRDHPECNVDYTPEGMVRHGNVDIGVAVAVPDGLVVPVVRFADQKSLRQISIEVRDLATRAKERKLRPEEMTGSTFSVSNLGMFGVSEFSAVVNPGEGAILAVGALEDAAVVMDGQVGVQPIMAMTLSCDHRAIDGATGARFLATVREYLERPLKLFT